MKNTVEDFWTMIFDYDVHLIVMLCKVDESGSNKCYNYWEGVKENEQSQFKIDIDEKKEDKKFVIREFNIMNKESKEKKCVKQIHFIEWPDHNVPDIDESFDSFVEIINLVLENNGNKPVVVHCSAGVGRTGTFVSMYNLYFNIMNQIKGESCEENEGNNNDIEFSIYELVRKLKEKRRYLVENINQYRFIYMFVESLLYLNNKNLKNI